MDDVKIVCELIEQAEKELIKLKRLRYSLEEKVLDKYIETFSKNYIFEKSTKFDDYIVIKTIMTRDDYENFVENFDLNKDCPCFNRYSHKYDVGVRLNKSELNIYLYKNTVIEFNIN
jgi:hypothetical protein